MQYDTIEELTLELTLYPNKKMDILEDCARECEYGWFTVAKDGNCALFDETGELDDINKVKSINEGMIPKDIEKIIIPDAMTVIQDYSFYHRVKLTDVTIPDSVTSIGKWAFSYCYSLTNVTIPDSVTSIEHWAFANCIALINVTIGDSVTSIGDSAFWYCSSLKSVTIPDSVTYIGYGAFAGCINIKELIFKSKTLEEVQSMKKYPFGIEDESIIRCEGE